MISCLISCLTSTIINLSSYKGGSPGTFLILHSISQKVKGDRKQSRGEGDREGSVQGCRTLTRSRGGLGGPEGSVVEGAGSSLQK